MVCPGCEGRGCKGCDEKGEIDITECPLETITNDVREIIALTELFQKGLPPISGGTLEQAKVFVEAARFIIGEEQRWKNKLGILS